MTLTPAWIDYLVKQPCLDASSKTNREGAANFDDDVPLPSIFKFAQFNVDKICSLIKESCTKHGEYANAKKLEKYKEWILDQRVSTVYLYPIRLRYIIYARCNRNSNIPLNQTSTYLTLTSADG